jgi:hypothetical protein
MLILRTTCLAAFALVAAAGPVSAQKIQINIGRPPPFRRPVHNIGWVGGYRPLPGIYRPPTIGVINVAPPVFRPPAVVTLRPTIYPASYLSLFTPGYQTILVGGTSYYYYPQLPVGATAVPVAGATYYQAGGIWYQPYTAASGNIFLIVPPPV